MSDAQKKKRLKFHLSADHPMIASQPSLDNNNSSGIVSVLEGNFVPTSKERNMFVTCFPSVTAVSYRHLSPTHRRRELCTSGNFQETKEIAQGNKSHGRFNKQSQRKGLRADRTTNLTCPTCQRCSGAESTGKPRAQRASVPSSGSQSRKFVSLKNQWRGRAREKEGGEEVGGKRKKGGRRWEGKKEGPEKEASPTRCAPH